MSFSLTSRTQRPSDRAAGRSSVKAGLSFVTLAAMMLVFAMIAMAGPVFAALSPDATLVANTTVEGVTAVLTAPGVSDRTTVTMSLIAEDGSFYVMPASFTSTETWQASFPVVTPSGELSADVGLETIAKTKIATSITTFTLKDSSSRRLSAAITLVDTMNRSIVIPSESAMTLPPGAYRAVITPDERAGLAVKRISVSGLRAGGNIDIGVENIPTEGIAEQAYAIDPTRMSFDNATITVKAKGTYLYKCAAWNFTTQECLSEWTVLREDLVPGEDYTIVINATDPAFIETISYCRAEQNSETRDNFIAGCTVAAGTRLLRNDATLETHTANASRWGGVLIESVNASVSTCESILSTRVCYEWWSAAATKNCRIAVDADGGTNFTNVTTVCPGTVANPGVTCTDVTGLETWTCTNFFGAAGTRARALADAQRNVSATTTNIRWDVFVYNVTYDPIDSYGGEPTITSNVIDREIYVDGVRFNQTADYAGTLNVTVKLDGKTALGFRNNFTTTTLNLSRITLNRGADNSLSVANAGYPNMLLSVPLNGTRCYVTVCDGVMTAGGCNVSNTRYVSSIPVNGTCPVYVNGTYAKDSFDDTNFRVLVSDILITPSSPQEGQNVTVNVTARNVGMTWADDVVLAIRDETKDTVLANVTIANFTVGMNMTVIASYTATPGPHRIVATIDDTARFNESDETDNSAMKWANTSVWQTVYGSVFTRDVLAGGTRTFHAWPATFDATNGTIYAVDADAAITWSNLYALTRTTADALASQDLVQADTVLNTTGFNDSVRMRFGTDDSTPRATRNMTLFGRNVRYVPVINSTITSDFQTGILWDATLDGDGEYDGTEDLVFATAINANKAGVYGTYDYELVVPSTLQNTRSGTTVTAIYVEIT
jgi:hypothetical protein